MHILGVRVDNLEKKEILEKISGFLDEDKFHQIATVNAEFILEAQKNQRFKDILNGCDLNVADSVSICYACYRECKILKARLAGSDLMMEILHLASEKNIPIFLAARKGGLSSWEETHDAILKIYPDLKISGGNIDIENINNKIGNDTCQIVFSNFGAPHQELFLNSQKSAKIRLAMGVGGSFDFLTGKIRRAPKWMRKIGLEWLWRLWQWQEFKYKKKRIQRVFKAVVVFPIRVIFGK